MKKNQQGFTLVELMVTVSIVGILAFLAAPSFSSFVTKGRADSVTQQLFSDLNAARMESIKRNRRVLVCPSANTTTVTTCAAGSSWNNGWILCIDGNIDGVCDSITSLTDPNYPNPFTIRSALNSQIVVTGSVNPITFKPDGSAIAASLSVVAGSTTKTVSVATSGSISQN